MTVYVTQENPSFDYSPAEEYGDVVFVSKDDYSTMPNSLLNDDVSAGIRKRLMQFKHDTDYVVPSGSPVVSAAVFMALGKHGAPIRVLKWVGRNSKYTPITLRI